MAHSLSSSVTLLNETRHDALGRVLRVQGVAELLTEGVVLLPERERLEHGRVPFILEGLEKGGDGTCTRGPRGRGFWVCTQIHVTARIGAC